ncbi:hypothetical protein ACV3V0_16265 [Clostridium perfringens]
MSFDCKENIGKTQCSICERLEDNDNILKCQCCHSIFSCSSCEESYMIEINSPSNSIHICKYCEEVYQELGLEWLKDALSDYDDFASKDIIATLGESNADSKMY